MKAKPQTNKNSFKQAIVKSAIIHVCVLLLFSISPGFDLAIKDKPVDVVWVEIPKGTSTEIGYGLKGTTGFPETTIAQSKARPAPTQEPLELDPKTTSETLKPALKTPEASAEKKPTIEKTVTAAPTKMTYEKEGAPRVKTPARSKTDRKISDALAMIDKSLAERPAAPAGSAYEEGEYAPAEAGQVGQYSEGYIYGTGTKPLKVLPSDPEYIKYQAMVRAKIIGQWIVPDSLIAAGSKANAKLIVLINMDGEVISMKWSKKSGNPSFDESAKRAVEKASPLPRPPERLAWETYNEGFLIEFDARAR